MATFKLKIDLHSGQLDVYKCKARYRVIAAGRRWGKTTLALFEILIKALQKPNSKIWYVAPSYKQAKLIAWDKLKEFIPPELVSKINEAELKITLFNNSNIELKGCDNEDSLRGVALDFLVFDEIGVVQNAKNIWQEVLRPMLVDHKAPVLFIGTPKGQNYFYEIYQLGQSGKNDYQSFRFKTKDNPFISREEVIQAQKDSHPTYFSQEYEASFCTDEEMSLITSKDLERLKGHALLYNEVKECVVVDPSQGGDECVIYAMRNYKVIDEQILHERDMMKIVGHVVTMLDRHNIIDVAGDSIGIGAGLFDRLDEMKRYRVHRINSAENAQDNIKFYNVRAEMWWVTMELIRDMKVSDLECMHLRRQIVAVKYKVSDSNGRIQLEPKHKTKLVIGESPDRADTYVMGCYAMNNLVEPVEKDPYRAARYEEIYDFNPMVL